MAVAIAIANFVAQHFTLEPAADIRSTLPFHLAGGSGHALLPGASVYPATDPQLTITGFYGDPINTIADVNNDSAHVAKINVGVPRGWTSVDVAQFIIKKFHDDRVINEIASTDMAPIYKTTPRSSAYCKPTHSISQ